MVHLKERREGIERQELRSYGMEGGKLKKQSLRIKMSERKTDV